MQSGVVGTGLYISEKCIYKYLSNELLMGWNYLFAFITSVVF